MNFRVKRKWLMQAFLKILPLFAGVERLHFLHLSKKNEKASLYNQIVAAGKALGKEILDLKDFVYPEKKAGSEIAK